MISYIHKTVLGSAQLRMPYGIANRTGAPTEKESLKILQTAWASGIRCFDTAPGYQSECFIGEFIATEGLHKEIRVLTKIPALNRRPDWKDFISASVENSLANLRCRSIEVLFFHHPQDAVLLLEEPRYFADLLSSFPVKTLGVSVYDPLDIDRVKDCSISLAFQFPFNLLDRRFDNNTVAAGKRYARSVFLQGLLAATKLRDSVPEELKRIHAALMEDCRRHDISLAGQALKFVVESRCLDFFLIGVESSEQLRQLVALDLSPEIPAGVVEKWRSAINPKWLDPRTWN